MYMMTHEQTTQFMQQVAEIIDRHNQIAKVNMMKDVQLLLIQIQNGVVPEVHQDPLPTPAPQPVAVQPTQAIQQAPVQPAQPIQQAPVQPAQPDTSSLMFEAEEKFESEMGIVKPSHKKGKRAPKTAGACCHTGRDGTVCNKPSAKVAEVGKYAGKPMCPLHITNTLKRCKGCKKIQTKCACQPQSS